jgi:hypothetical protein
VFKFLIIGPLSSGASNFPAPTGFQQASAAVRPLFCIHKAKLSLYPPVCNQQKDAVCEDLQGALVEQSQRMRHSPP